MMRKLTLLSLVFLAALVMPALASTTCKVDDCKITITLNIAFAGATDAQINGWVQEISGIWNGQGGRTTGDCKCPVVFNVNASKAANCTPMPAGKHCITVLPWNGTDASLPHLPAGPRAGEAVVAYMGKTTQSPSVGGASLDGEWSNITSRPVNSSDPAQGNYNDAAHEAGHMMGLADGSGGIMNFTSGPGATATQANIDQAVQNVCGANACPDKCCCGNGVIDGNKGEGCDPKALPNGCSGGEFCCAICCQCHSLANGLYNFDVASAPLGLFSNERANIFIDGKNMYFITQNNEVVEVGSRQVEHPTLNIYMSPETAEEIHDGELGMIPALKQGKIRYEGADFFSALKFGIVGFFSSIFLFFM